jgi:hypothetical protein
MEIYSVHTDIAGRSRKRYVYKYTELCDCQMLQS